MQIGLVSRKVSGVAAFHPGQTNGSAQQRFVHALSAGVPMSSRGLTAGTCTGNSKARFSASLALHRHFAMKIRFTWGRCFGNRSPAHEKAEAALSQNGHAACMCLRHMHCVMCVTPRARTRALLLYTLRSVRCHRFLNASCKQCVVENDCT